MWCVYQLVLVNYYRAVPATPQELVRDYQITNMRLTGLIQGAESNVAGPAVVKFVRNWNVSHYVPKKMSLCCRHWHRLSAKACVTAPSTLCRKRDVNSWLAAGGFR